MSLIKAWAATAAGGACQPFTYDPGPLGADQVEIAVEYCGICHSDLSMLQNDWGITRYPFVPGHEAVGRIVALGDQVAGLALGQRVGIGWTARSRIAWHHCLAGRAHPHSGAPRTNAGPHGGPEARRRGDTGRRGGCGRGAHRPGGARGRPRGGCLASSARVGGPQLRCGMPSRPLPHGRGPQRDQEGREHPGPCLLYTSDAADERSSVDLGGRRIIKKKK